MSETPLAAASAAVPPPARTRTRAVLIAGAVVAALAGGGAVLLGTLGDGGSTTAAAPVVHRVPGSTGVRPSATTSPVPVPVPSSVDTGSVVAARNPYKALITPPTSTATAGAPTGAAGPAGGDPTAPVTPVPTSTTTPGTTTAGPAAPYTVTLVSVGALQGDVRPMAWTVAGVKQTVYKGQLFGAAGELQVLSVAQVNGVWTALLQVAHAAPQPVKVGSTLSVS